ncbi:MAG: Brp/Blh family beta-carotene 15,15'-dioxygenase, partial [Planctomycetota bacterium]
MNALPGYASQHKFEELVFRRLPLAGMLAAAVAAIAFGPQWSVRAAALPWLVSLVFVGLPHGAADLAIAQRLGSRAGAVRMFVGYFAVMVAVFVGFAMFPVPLVLLFAALSIWHFGMS